VADLLAALPVAAAAAVVIAGAVASAVAGAGAIVGENLAIDFNHNFDDKKENFFRPGVLSRICYLGPCEVTTTMTTTTRLVRDSPL
jgi:hypothetical protein